MNRTSLRASPTGLAEPLVDQPHCRFCAARLTNSLIDLGMSPLANSYLTPFELNRKEAFYPLHVYLCDECLLVQLEEFKSPEHIFTDYAYFSSYSDSWVRHARAYAELVTARFGLGPHSWVLELASNDGYLLQYFVEKGIPVLGIEPAVNVAQAAIENGIPTLVQFFGVELARELIGEGKRADLVVGNNVLAHVPRLNDFIRGMKVILRPSGVITMEFPHLLQLMAGNQFDTIYHEHFSYFSFLTVERIFASHGLTLFDVEELPTHGGSLRIYGRHRADSSNPITSRVEELRAREINEGLDRVECYLPFAERVKLTKRKLLAFLIRAKEEGKSIVGYGAAAKGNTLLNYCGVGTDFIDYTVDRSPHKQDHFLPGTHIPIYHPDRIKETQPDYLLVLAWNLRDEIMESITHIRDWGGRFVVAVPEIEIEP